MAYANGDSGISGTVYATLLQALRANKDATPVRKKQKLNDGPRGDAANSTTRSTAQATVEGQGMKTTAEDLTADLIEPADDAEGDGAEPGDAVDDEDLDDESDALLQDPFEKHYFNTSNLELLIGSESSVALKPKPVSGTTADGIRKTWVPCHTSSEPPTPVKKQQDLSLKKRLVSSAADLYSSLSVSEKDITGAIFTYRDVLVACRTVENAPLLRDICALQSLNHVFKTRDRVLKNNAKLSQTENADALDIRDQGFTRPKVLIIIPTKQACVRFVESIVKLSEPEQQENKSRFLETFSREDAGEWREKPEDFRELFGGNHEEDFRIGLKFTRKTIKYFSGFYNSDIIICSPLGLMRTITTSGKGTETKKSQDADFLSSIEVLIMDHASALQMQNWQHVEYLFSQLNQLPKESHGCDFTRVRNWYLDGHAKYLRQTIILSAYLTPEINALVSAHLHNLDGRVRYVPHYGGAMLEVSNLLPVPVTQTFLRFDSPAVLNDGDARFKYFTTAILPQLVRDRNNQQGVLIFVPSYLDFVRVRNHLTNSSESTSVSFGNISEYTPIRDVARARSHFISGRHSLLLYSERAHHHFRYRLRGVRKIVFYGVPENPIFWTEVVGLLALEAGSLQSDSKTSKGIVRALFSRWDAMKLERVVGTERFGKMVSERIGDTFDFV
jgi:U3 small nucleolar RNA-associated protein 25